MYDNNTFMYILDMCQELDTEILKNLIDNIGDIIENREDERCCSICGKEMTEGYYNEDEFQYYCSDDCLHKDYTDEEYQELYNNGNGNFYYTSWED